MALFFFLKYKLKSIIKEIELEKRVCSEEKEEEENKNLTPKNSFCFRYYNVKDAVIEVRGRCRTYRRRCERRLASFVYIRERSDGALLFSYI